MTLHGTSDEFPKAGPVPVVLSAVARTILILAAAGALAGCAKRAEAPDEDEAKVTPKVQVSLATVRRGTIRSTLSLTGTLSPLDNMEARVAPLAPGRIARMFVHVGDLVTQGQVVATLDSGVLLGQERQADATVRADTATLMQARLNFRAQQDAETSGVRLAVQNLRAQQVALDKLLAGSRPQEIRQAQMAVTSAQAALTNADQSLTRSRTLFGEGLLARKDLEAAEAQQKSAQAALESAGAGLSLAKQGNRPQDIEAGRVAVAQAEAQLQAARQQRVVTAARAQDVRIAERQLQGAEGALHAVLVQLNAQEIRAPITGTVTGRTLNPGESVDVTGAVATIVNLDRVRLLLSAPAAQAGSIRPGMPVEFTTGLSPGRTYRAEVRVVNRAVDTATDTVQVEAIVDNADRTLRDDGFVHASITLATHSEALIAPAGAIVQRENKLTIFTVDAGNRAHPHEVRTGLREGGNVEILAGVRAGDRIVTTGAYELEDNAEVLPPPSAVEKGASGGGSGGGSGPE
jgi:membrane fusion protein (multidrug efflux system)